MGFKELDEVIDLSMRLPVNGKIYSIPPVDSKTGLWLQRLMKVADRVKDGDGTVTDVDVASLQLDDAEEENLYQRVLGPVYEELLADKVDWEKLKFVAQTATVRAMSNLESAENFWNAGGRRPKAKKKPADRKRKASAK